jgi:phospholipase C
MLANRSFDHMLGYLRATDSRIDGVDDEHWNPAGDGTRVYASADAQYIGDLLIDPGHNFFDVNLQVFGSPTGLRDPESSMKGFVRSYRDHAGDSVADRVMRCFAPARIPVLTTLASQYAICDRWFSSVPGPSLPNRAFALAATSLGHVDMNPLYFGSLRTIHGLLADRGVSSRIYYHDFSIAVSPRDLQEQRSKLFGPFDMFLTDCQNSTLPSYSVIEPRYADSAANGLYFANDQRPGHNVLYGEELIRTVYEAVRGNPQIWEHCLLAIVYDCHGGLYDHCVPPAAQSPDNHQSVTPLFSFDRLGVRVPAVLVSPYIPEHTVDSTVYDHTSLIATARKLFTNDAATNALTRRDGAANAFESIASLDLPRPDTVMFQRSVAAARAKERRPIALSDYQQALLDEAWRIDRQLAPAEASLPSLTTENEVAAYIIDVMKKVQTTTAKVSIASNRPSSADDMPSRSPSELVRPAIRAIVSYSHQDEVYKLALMTHLSPLRREGLLDVWQDREIQAGTEFDKSIQAQLHEVDVFLLLVTADFINSDYCYRVELPQGMERQAAGTAIVIPVIVRPCEWENAPFAKLQALPKDGRPVTTWNNRDAAWLDVIRGVRAAVEAFRHRTLH